LTWLIGSANYRDRDQREIDVLIVQDGTAYPIEIKKTSQPSRDAIRHFSAVAATGLAMGPGAVICLTDQRVPITAEVDAVPAWQVA